MFYEKQYKFILFKKIIRQIIQLVLQKIIWKRFDKCGTWTLSFIDEEYDYYLLDFLHLNETRFNLLKLFWSSRFSNRRQD